VRVVPAGSRDDSKESPPEIAENQTSVAALPKMKNFEAPVDANEAALSRPNDSLMRAGRRRTL